MCEEKNRSSNTLWVKLRLELCELLGKLDQTLAGLYAHVIDLLDKSSEGSLNMADALVIGHCMREVINALPDVFMSTQAPGRSMARSSQASAIKSVVQLWQKMGDSSTANSPSDRPNEYTELADALDKLLIAYEKGGMVNRQRDATIVSNEMAAGGATFKAWRNTREFFMGITHYSIDSKRHLPSKEEIVKHLEVFETVLKARLGSFFDVVDELEAILAEANDISNGWKEPTNEMVARAVARLGSYNHRLVFFKSLRNPLWVKPLQKSGAFKEMPVDVDTDGMYPIWCEGDYLVHVAREQPEPVSSILKSRSNSLNPYVRRAIVAASCTMPEHYSLMFVDDMVRWANEADLDAHPYEMDMPHIEDIIVTMLKGSSEQVRRKGKKLFRAYFGFHRSASSYGEPRAAMLSFHYGDMLRRVITSVAPDLGVELLKICVESYCRQSSDWRDLNAADPYPTHMWCEYIENADFIEGHDYGREIVVLFRDFLLEHGGIEPRYIEGIWKLENGLAKRIALYCVESILTDLPVKPNGLVHAPLIKLTQEMIDWQPLLREYFDSESLPLVRYCLSHRNQFDCSSIEISLRDSYEYWRNKTLNSGHLLDRQLADVLSAHRQQRLLALVGKELLPADLRKRLDELNDQHGVDKFSEGLGLVPSAGFLTPQSPLSSNEMIAMVSTDLLAFLLSWEPDQGDHVYADKYALANQLQIAVKDKPELMACLLPHLAELDYRYVCSLCDVYKEVPHSVVGLDSKSVFKAFSQVIKKVVRSVDAANPPQVGDGSYRLMLAIAEATNDLKEEDYSGMDDDSLSLLVSIFECTLSFPDRCVMDNKALLMGSSPLEVALNSTTATTLRSIAKSARCVEDKVLVDKLRNLYLGCLSSNNASPTIGSAIGLSVLDMYCAGEGWTRAHKVELFGKDSPNEMQKMALAATLCLCRYHMGLFELMREGIISMLTSGLCYQKASRNGTDVISLSGEWIYLARCEGRMQKDDELVSLWMGRSTPGDRAVAMSHLISAVLQNDAPTSMVQSMLDLWDERLAHVQGHAEDAAELVGIWALADSGKIPVEWWGPRLLDVSRINPEPDDLLMHRDVLGRYAVTDSLGALEVLENYDSALRDGSDRLRFFIEDIAAPILASAMSCSDETAKERAAEYMDRLGRRGFIDIRDRVLSTIPT